MKTSDNEFVFNNISRLADILRTECETLCEVIDFEDDMEVIVRKVSALEDDADNVYHDITYYYVENKLADDKEAMILLTMAEAIEDTTDKVDELARDLVRYNITSIKDNAFSSIKSCESAANKLIELIMTMRKNSKVDSPYKKIIELDHFKVENNKLYDNQMRKLFTKETDPIEVIKWKDIYSSLRSIFESYEYVAELCSKYLIFQGW
ncbi:MAG: hypothetical protein J5883_04610 [Clostridiales bacterium]|nr:hypothetical protein [Clostridiales bacterium]